MSKHVHIITICGVATGGLAVAFKKLGWKVTGSDVGVYPPVSTYLEKNKIKFDLGFDASRLSSKPDLVVVGGGALIADKQNPEVIQAQKLGLNTLSYPEVLEKYLIKKNSVVVAGTYGKTTTTAALAWIFSQAGFDPSYMIGGMAKNFDHPMAITDSDWSIVEGDEHPTLYFSPESKFMHYKPKYLLLTSAQWDHFNVFSTPESYILAFKKLVRTIPRDGLIVACSEGENVDEVIKDARCKVIRYSVDNSSGWSAGNINYNHKNVDFDVIEAEGNRIKIKSSLFGKFNVQNIVGAVCMAANLGIDKKIIANALAGYQGIKRRQEVIFKSDKCILIEDFAQHPVKVSQSLTAIKQRYYKHSLAVVFDPHASVLKTKESLNWYKGKFNLADKVFVRRVKLLKSDKEKVTGNLIVKAMSLDEGKAIYEPRDDKIIEFMKHLNKPTVVILFSSGDWGDFKEKILNAVKNER